ncbi:Small integral membrane protein [Citrobacter koseri]|uniref:Small integral membrane protein n=1 Tax=Citrobacter koseri TaxID=545 RepID=A0A2X2XJR7_CITKO|nr:Small integral membrane protein [Citrobacter koseri]
MYTTLKISRMSNLNAHIKRSTLTMVKEKLMFRWGIIFLVIALIAAALGFGWDWQAPRLAQRKLSSSSGLSCS